MGNFWSELKRRNVVRVGGIYVVTSWVLLQALDTVGQFLDMPMWIGRLVIMLLLLCLPAVLYFGWSYTLSEGALKRVDRADGKAPGPMDYLTMAALFALICGGAYLVFLNQNELFQEQTLGEQQLQSENLPEEKRTAAHVVSDNSIAVLPFVNMSSDPEQEYFSDGISEEILNVLARMPGLQVTSRTSSFSFKGKSIPIPQIAAELGVAYVLEGSIRKGGNRVRITAQLIHVASDSHLFSDAWDRDLDDVFAVQDEISAIIGDILQLKLVDEKAVNNNARQRQQMSPEMLDNYLQATQLMALTSFSNASQAETLLKNIIQQAPDFSQARSRLANVYLSMVQLGTIHPDDAIRQALPLAEEALALEPTNAEALNTLSFIHRSNGDNQTADELLDRALTLEPGNAAALRQAVSNTAYGRNFTPVDELVERLLRVDPLSETTLIVAQDYYRRAGNMEKALEIMTRLENIEGTELMYATLMTVNNYHQGGPSETLRYTRIAYDLETRFAESVTRLVLALLDVGLEEEAAQLLANAPALATDTLQRLQAKMYYHLYRREMSEAYANAQLILAPELPDRYGAKAAALRVAMMEAIERKEGYSSTIALYLEVFPELSNKQVPNNGQLPPILIKYGHFMAANDLALLYQLSGDTANAEALNDNIERELQQWPRTSVLGSGIADAELYARAGRQRQALDALAQALAQNWHRNWWFNLQLNHQFDNLRSNPEFLALVEKFSNYPRR